MITIEASNIYFRGGFVLLEQILEYCEENMLEAKVYIGYQEVFETLKAKKFQYVELIQTSGFQTLLRYCKRRSHVLFFCNLPPFVRNNKSVLYAHNILFFQSAKYAKGESLVFNIKKFVYYYWIKFFARNVDIVACQTDAVKQALFENMRVKSELYPFYRAVKPLELERKYDFCYVGSGAKHKNNFRLLQAVDELSERYCFHIQMTISNVEIYKELLERMDYINRKYGREIILNKGFVPNNEVAEIYASSLAMIFPSIAETIALPLIEGLQYGLKILSSDLNFTYQVVENPIVFNPLNVEAIKEVMEKQLIGEFKQIHQRNRIQNKLAELIACIR